MQGDYLDQGLKLIYSDGQSHEFGVKVVKEVENSHTIWLLVTQQKATFHREWIGLLVILVETGLGNRPLIANSPIYLVKWYYDMEEAIEDMAHQISNLRIEKAWRLNEWVLTSSNGVRL